MTRNNAVTSVGPAESNGSAPAILYVEDHLDTLKVVTRLLRAGGYHVANARSFAEAVDAAAQMPRLDVLIADMRLPDGDGIDLFLKLRTSRPAMHGICLTGCGMPADIRRTMDAGYRCHILKPTDFEALESELRAIAHDLALRDAHL